MSCDDLLKSIRHGLIPIIDRFFEPIGSRVKMQVDDKSFCWILKNGLL